MRRSNTFKLEPLVAMPSSLAPLASPATSAVGELRRGATLKLKPLHSLQLQSQSPPSLATAALEAMMKETPSKRAKQFAEDTPRRSNPSLLASFDEPEPSEKTIVSFVPPKQSKTTSLTFAASKQAKKFDMTELFQATESSTNNNHMFDFPALSWPGLEEKEDNEDQPLRRDASPETKAASPVTAALSSSNKDPSCSSSSSSTRRATSASCLLVGKRNRSGGMLRSKTMRSEVDRLVHHHHSNLMFSFGSSISLGSTSKVQ